MSTIDRFLNHLGIKQIPSPTEKSQEYALLRERYLRTYEQAFERLEGHADLSEAVGALVEALAEMDEYERKHAFWSGMLLGMKLALKTGKDSSAPKVG